MMNEETVRAEDEMREAYLLLPGRKQDRDGPVVKLISMTKPEGLEVWDLARLRESFGGLGATLTTCARRRHAR